MNENGKRLLLEIIKGGIIKQTSLQKDLKLSERQIDYQLQSINNVLKQNNLPTVIKRNGNFMTDLSVKQYMKIKEDRSFILSVEQRQNYIVLLILTRNTELFLNHFVDELHVSRNTIISDIRRLKKRLDRIGLKLDFNRKDGYLILGSERKKRNFLRKVLIIFYREYGYDLTQKLLSNAKEYIRFSEDIIRKLEKEINIIYTDKDYEFLSLFLSCIFLRRDRGCSLENELNDDDIKEITDTLEYKKLSKVISNVPEIDMVYITLQFLGTNVKKSNTNGFELNYKITNALWQFILDFETKSFMTLQDKKFLIEQLIDHFRPAYFRIKYEMELVESLTISAIKKYLFLQEIVERSLDSLRDLLGKEIPENEVIYITIFIGGHLLDKEQKSESKVIKAITVCPNGISASKILERELKKIFPEFLFYPACSVRDYTKFDLPHDIVFTDVAIKSAHKVYLVKNFMSNSEKNVLRRKVLGDIFKINFNQDDIENIINIVKKYAEIKNISKLEFELNELLLSSDKEEISLQENSDQILKESSIQILKGTAPWKYVVHSVVEPLINKTIEFKGLEKIWNLYKECPGYIFLNNQIILLHIDPEKVKQKLGLSIVVSSEGIRYGNEKAHVVALLTTPDKTSHLDTLYFISELSKNNKVLKEIWTSSKVDSIKKTLINYNRRRV